MAAPKRGHLGGVIRPGNPYRSDGGDGPTFPNRTPNANYYSETPYNQLPKAERAVWKSKLKQEMNGNPLLTFAAIPGIAIKGMHAAISDALGGRKDLVYKKGTTPTKRQTGK
jgi:hypothetical protein